MATRAPQPSAGEIKAIAEILQADWPGARKKLARYFAGEAPWDGALRTVRAIVKDVLSSPDKGSRIPIGKRLKVYEFANDYGTMTRAPVTGEARTDRITIRFAPESERGAIAAAAKIAGVPEADFIRDAAVVRARQILAG